MKHTISVLVENHSGVLSRISGLFSRRGFNIESLAVGPTNDESISRITIVADGDEHTVEQIEKQLNKLIEFVARELMIVKVSAPADKRSEIMTIAEITGAKVMDITLTTMTLEICDRYDRLERFEKVIEPYGILEMARTGTVAVERGAEYFSAKK